MRRKRMLGNMRFIGELYLQNMLHERIMHECLQRLAGNIETPKDDDMERLVCVFLSVFFFFGVFDQYSNAV